MGIASAFHNHGGRTPDSGEQGLLASTGIFFEVLISS
jgi:hypothetical protein